ncbi:MAG: sugar ABC transporter permease [Candidatus Cloacimonetes bacterium]|nr:sugar ABC transporter permease [Candidatus Cloacimonadota bacterium]
MRTKLTSIELEKRKLKRRKQLKEDIAGYLFILPNLVGFLVFTMFAVVFSFLMSFTDWSLIKKLSAVKWVGLKNYIDLFSDKWFQASVINNLWFLLVVPVTIFLAMIFAFLMNDKIFFKKGFRTILYLPNITSTVAVSVVWFTLFNPRMGPVNQLLMALGVDNPPQWLISTVWAKPCIGLLMIWKSVGYYSLLYLAALQGIPKQLYESATMDGASGVKQFFKITIPLLSPTTFMLTILSVMNNFKDWSLIQIMTEGGPGTSTYNIGYYIYYVAFRKSRMGYASAISWVLLLILMVFTIIRFYVEKKKDF